MDTFTWEGYESNPRIESEEYFEPDMFDIIQWEAGSCSFVASIWWRIFPSLFHRHCEKKYKRYQEFLKLGKP